MKRLNLALALLAAALLALSGIAVAKDRHGDDHGRDDHHRHHRHHHRHDIPLGEAGKIASFDATSGRLTVALTGGETVTGLVTGATRIRCEGVDDRRARRDHGGRGNEPGDDHGGRGEEPGDDHGEGGPPAEVPPPPAAAEAGCSPASLTPGEIVGSAELRLEGGMATFEEVELGLHS
ncbi:MAG TPA: hypothetical protein VHA80_15120 [Solirubrobacterales bacterium]|nr:hypothetical protein [Solirubrobacterales bacterium]